MFKRKQEVYTIKEFMALNRAESGLKKRDKIEEQPKRNLGFLTGVTIPLAIAPFTHLQSAFAYSGNNAIAVTAAGNTTKVDALYDKMLHAFDPLITLVQALAYPVAMVVVLGGALFIMIGNKEKGFTLMQNAGLGYVLVQLTPLVLNILVEAMKAVA